jgi:hypothetical protein
MRFWLGFEKLESSRAPGLDRYIYKALLYGGVRLGVHLALLFNCSVSVIHILHL